jgi:hypothetical protein
MLLRDLQNKSLSGDRRANPDAGKRSSKRFELLERIEQ